MSLPLQRRRPRERGALLLITINVIVILSSLGAAFLMVGLSEYSEHRSTEERTRAFYIAEAGLSDALDRLSNDQSGTIGSSSAPVPFSGGGYWVASIPNADGSYTITSTGTCGAVRQTVEGLAKRPSQLGYFSGAGFGDMGVQLLDSAQTDSYDSTQGTYLSQATQNLGLRNYAKDKGDVDSNGPVQFGVFAGVFGNVRPGVSNLVSLVLGALVTGSTAPRTAVKARPPVVVPADLAGLPLGNATINNTTQNFAPGDYRLSKIDVKGFGRMIVRGPATILVDRIDLDNTGRIVVDSTDGPVFFYVTERIRLRADSKFSSLTMRPMDVLVFATIDNYTGHESQPEGDGGKPVVVQDRADFAGLLYAPNAVISVKNQGEVFGTAFGRKLRMANTGRIHYDEVLAHLPNVPTGRGKAKRWAVHDGEWEGKGFELVVWRRVSSPVPTRSR